MGPDAIILVFWMFSFKPTFSLFHLSLAEPEVTILHLDGDLSSCRKTQENSRDNCSVYPLKRNQDPALLLHCYFLAAPPSFPNSFASLVSNCLSLFFRTPGKSRSMPFFLQTWTGDLERLLYLGRPHRVLLVFSCSFELPSPEPTVLERRQAWTSVLCEEKNWPKLPNQEFLILRLLNRCV